MTISVMDTRDSFFCERLRFPLHNERLRLLSLNPVEAVPLYTISLRSGRMRILYLRKSLENTVISFANQFKEHRFK